MGAEVIYRFNGSAVSSEDPSSDENNITAWPRVSQLLIEKVNLNEDIYDKRDWNKNLTLNLLGLRQKTHCKTIETK